MKNRVLNSPHLKELKKRKHLVIRKKAVIIFFLFVIFFVGIIFLSRWQKINIQYVDIIGNKTIKNEVIKDEFEKIITGKYLWIFPKTNSFIYPKNEIQQYLSDKFKIFENVSMELKNLNTLTLEISEREAKYVWCGENFPQELEKPCYFMDNNGYIFDNAPYFSGNVYFKYFGLIDNINENPIGTYFAKENFKDMISFINYLKNIKINPSSLVLKKDGDIEIYLVSENQKSEQPKIIFKGKDDWQKILENLSASLETEPFKSDFKNKYSSLLYIDLRFGNKFVYKFK